NLAQGYGPSGRTAYPDYFGAAAGLISSVTDMAVYSNALDGTALLRDDTRARAWTPTISLSGATLPYGMGWFTQTLQGVKLVWHYGYWIANSPRLIKAPEKGLTSVLLANTDGLGAQFPLGPGA